MGNKNKILLKYMSTLLFTVKAQYVKLEDIQQTHEVEILIQTSLISLMLKKHYCNDTLTFHVYYEH